MEYLINSLIWGSIGIVIVFLWLFIKNYRKALEDPDVKLASKLGMSMPIYRDCQEIFEEMQKWYSENPNGNIDEMHIRMPKNPNAYRKYEEYRFFMRDVEKWEHYSDDMKSMLEFDNPYKKEEYQWLRKLNLI